VQKPVDGILLLIRNRKPSVGGVEP